jgi:integrase
MHSAVLLGLLGGLRLGEVRALLWRDIDFGNCTVRVNKAMTKDRRGEIVGSPKTERGKRTIDMNPWVIEELRVLRDRVAANEPDASTRPVVVGPLSHKRVRSGQLYKVCRRHAAALGVSTRFHDLRHTHASQLLRAGASIKVISERLDHASEAFTLRTYIHLLPGESRLAIRKLDTIYPEEKTA